jgi:hypothetical protein
MGALSRFPRQARSRSQKIFRYSRQTNQSTEVSAWNSLDAQLPVWKRASLRSPNGDVQPAANLDARRNNSGRAAAL